MLDMCVCESKLTAVAKLLEKLSTASNLSQSFAFSKSAFLFTTKASSL